MIGGHFTQARATVGVLENATAKVSHLETTLATTKSGDELEETNSSKQTRERRTGENEFGETNNELPETKNELSQQTNFSETKPTRSGPAGPDTKNEFPGSRNEL